MAYGQSATGKTHTMMGTDAHPGLVPRLCQALADMRPDELTVRYGTRHGNKAVANGVFRKVLSNVFIKVMSQSKRLGGNLSYLLPIYAFELLPTHLAHHGQGIEIAC